METRQINYEDGRQATARVGKKTAQVILTSVKDKHGNERLNDVGLKETKSIQADFATEFLEPEVVQWNLEQDRRHTPFQAQEIKQH